MGFVLVSCLYAELHVSPVAVHAPPFAMTGKGHQRFPAWTGASSWRSSAPDDYEDVTGMPQPAPDPAQALLDIYERALPAVYGYLLPRCGAATLAEDLTSVTFLAAVEAVRGDHRRR